MNHTLEPLDKLMSIIEQQIRSGLEPGDSGSISEMERTVVRHTRKGPGVNPAPVASRR